jgi:hypothetical protein
VITSSGAVWAGIGKVKDIAKPKSKTAPIIHFLFIVPPPFLSGVKTLIEI